jgi:hypothetical protein
MKPFFKAPKGRPTTIVMQDTVDGGTTSRPLIDSTDTPPDPASNYVQQYLNANWNAGVKSYSVPWPFQAAAIGPRSHFAFVGLLIQGRRPIVIGPESPLTGNFPANTQIIPFNNEILNIGGLLEVLFWPLEPESVLPSRRAPFTRYVVAGKAVQSEIDSVGAVTNPFMMICEGRTRLSIMMSNRGTDVWPSVAWQFDSPYDFENPNNNITNSIQYNDPQIMPNQALQTGQPAHNIAYFYYDVPVGATKFFLVDANSGQTIDKVDTIGGYQMTLSGEI